MATLVDLRLVALTTALACCGVAHAQPAGLTGAAPASTTSADEMAMPADLGAPLEAVQPIPVAATTSDDMAVPSDLGVPLEGAPALAAGAPPQDASSGAKRHDLSVDMPIAEIASSPKGKAVLEHALPGLCERVEYPMFKGMSLRALAAMSSGRITPATLAEVQTDFTRLGPVDETGAPAHGAFYPLTHTAIYSIRYGGRRIGYLSRALYHRMSLVIAGM